MTNNLFGRKFKLIIQLSGDLGIDIDSLKYTFKVEKTMTQEPNIAEITIYNLSDEISNREITKGAGVLLEAGYENGDYGLIFSGNIVQIAKGKENGTDNYLKILAQDNINFLNKNSINQTIKSGANHSDIINSIVNNSKEKTQTGIVAQELNQKKLSRGKVMFGDPKNIIREVAKSSNLQFYSDDGFINIVKTTNLSPNEALELNPSTGLIGYPTLNEDGISCVCLLNPRLALNSLIKIENKYINNENGNYAQNGVYKIIKLEFTGDTRGNDWYCNIEAISSPNKLPTLQSSETQNVW